MSKTITKSKYINGVQCPAFLWLEMNVPEKIAEPNSAVIHRMEQGTLAGELATKIFPDGINIPAKNFKENLKKTQELLKKRKPLFEAGFNFETEDGNIYARIDILRPAGKDKWDIIEVKSGTKIKGINLHDVSFQKYVCEKCGLKINKCILCHVNNEYVKQGEIKPEELFVLEEVDEQVDDLHDGVEDKIKKLFEVINLPQCPKVTCQDILNTEYSNVAIDEFYDSLPEENVFQLYRIFTKKAVELYEKGIIQIKDIPANFRLNDKQKIQKNCCDGKCSHVDKKEIGNFLKKLKYPLYYLDFETYNTIIPMFDGTKPYQQIPFQFSLHIVEERSAKPKHISFLADGASDPRPEFIKALKNNLGDEGSIVVFNESFEKRIIKDCCECFPLFAEWGEGVLSRIVDLLKPFRDFHFYHPNQKGSASIKNVLPIFSQDVNYKDLLIQNGEDASLSYLRSHVLGDASPEEKAKIRKALEKYCELDTYAEIVLVDGLGKVSAETKE